jgi:hypothetical protein
MWHFYDTSRTYLTLAHEGNSTCMSMCCGSFDWFPTGCLAAGW